MVVVGAPEIGFSEVVIMCDLDYLVEDRADQKAGVTGSVVIELECRNIGVLYAWRCECAEGKGCVETLAVRLVAEI